jgi:hypothetical protein
VASTADLIQQKLYDHFDLLDDLTLNDSEPETNAGALLQRWRALEGLTEWEDYVAEVFTAGGPDFFPDAENAYWTAFVP